MAENPFAKYKTQPTPQKAPKSQSANGAVNPFTKYKTAPQPNSAPANAVPAPQTVNTAGKGDIRLAPGQVAAGTYAEDAAKSFGSGVGIGTSALLGLPRDIADLTGVGVEWLAGKAGIDPQTAKSAYEAINPTSRLPSSATVRGNIESVTGEFYKPQTTVGEYSQTIGEFAPSALAGPGGLARKAVMTAVPAIISETAGQATKGTSAEPYARAAGALVGGGVTAGTKSFTNAKIMSGAAKSSKQLAKISKDAYSVADQTMSKIRMDQRTFGGIVRGMNNEASKHGFGGALSETTEKLYGKSRSIMNDMNKMFKDVASGGRPAPSYKDIEDYRKVLGYVVRGERDIKGNLSADGQLALTFQNKLDDFVARTPYKEARNAYRTRRKVERIEMAIEDAAQRGASEEQAVKNEFRKLVRENRKTKLFDVQELAYINRVANHTSASNMLETLGRLGFGPRSAFAGANAAGVSGGLGFALGGPVGAAVAAAGTAAVTSGAKKLGAVMTKNRANIARDFVAGGKSEAVQKQIAQESVKRLARRGVAVENSYQQSGGGKRSLSSIAAGK